VSGVAAAVPAPVTVIPVLVVVIYLIIRTNLRPEFVSIGTSALGSRGVSTLVDDPAAALRPRIQEVLDTFLAGQRRLLGDIGPELTPLVDAAADLLGGGKRLRPAFCYWGWRGAGGADGPAIIAAAAALELFQAAALIHDDLIDESDTRRGRPAAHRRFAADHTNAGWDGDPEAFGTAAAVLLGDLLLGWSDELLSTAGLRSDELARARPIFERMRTEVGAGQYLDVLAGATRHTPPSQRADLARRVIRYKAARYSVERPLLLGGSAAGAADELLAAYSAYGLALGEAFQLRDDVLGVFGDPAQTGKPAGDDLREGKQTLLIAYAAEHATAAQAETLDHLVGDPGLTTDGVAELRTLIVDTGALDRVEKLVAELVEQAGAALVPARTTASARTALEALIDAATTRTS
jgi:geranylgeranyl diphosphate synthase type I